MSRNSRTKLAQRHLLAEHGITVRAAFEPEFYLTCGIDGSLQSLPRTPVYSAIGHDAQASLSCWTSSMR